jgi:hypothetical protein
MLARMRALTGRNERGGAAVSTRPAAAVITTAALRPVKEH